MYRLAPFIDSLLGRAIDTFKITPQKIKFITEVTQPCQLKRWQVCLVDLKLFTEPKKEWLRLTQM